MEVKEAIEFLKLYKYNHIDEPCQEEEGINEIISLLQQGEKYRQIVEDIKKEFTYHWEDDIRPYKTGKFRKFNYKDIKYKIEKIEQKYFPKEAKQDKADNK